MQDITPSEKQINEQHKYKNTNKKTQKLLTNQKDLLAKNS